MRIAQGVLGAMLLHACAHGTPPPLHSTRLEVVRTSGGGFQPIVHAKVAGQPIRLLLDSGATQSMLPWGFVQTTSLRVTSRTTDDQIRDANGRLSTMPRVDGV